MVMVEPHFQTNCSNFTDKQFLHLVIAREASAVFCFTACLLTLALIVYYRLFKSVLQRLFLYLASSSLFYLSTVVLEGEHIFYYPRHGQKQVCQTVGFLVEWSATVEVLFTFGITSFINAKVIQEQFRGETLPQLTVKWQRTLECCFILTCILLPFTVVWLPFVHHTYGLGGAWCWIMSVSENCTDIGTRDQLLYFGPLIALTAFNVMLTLTVCVLLCIAARKYEATRHFHQMRAREVLLLLAFLIAYAVMSNTGIVPHFMAGLLKKRKLYSLWMADAVGTPLGKLVVPIAFLFYLYSFRKLSWSSIKAAAEEWKCSGKSNTPVLVISAEGSPTIHTSQVTSGYSSTHYSPPHSYQASSSSSNEEQRLLSDHRSLMYKSCND